jgi:hypothetical protein
MRPCSPQEWQVFTYSAGPPSSGRHFSTDAFASQFRQRSVMPLTLERLGERQVNPRWTQQLPGPKIRGQRPGYRTDR